MIFNMLLVQIRLSHYASSFSHPSAYSRCSLLVLHLGDEFLFVPSSLCLCGCQAKSEYEPDSCTCFCVSNQKVKTKKRVMLAVCIKGGLVLFTRPQALIFVNLPFLYLDKIDHR